MPLLHHLIVLRHDGLHQCVCVMSVNRHESRSRFPNYQSLPCAPASIYDVDDAREAYVATDKFLCKLQSEEKFSGKLGNLDQLPAKRFMSSLKSMSNNQGMLC